MKLLEWEDKVKKWIENHRVSWGFLLFGLGLGVGLGANFLLGGNISQGFSMGFAYAFLLVVVEVTAGGSGID